MHYSTLLWIRKECDDDDDDDDDDDNDDDDDGKFVTHQIFKWILELCFAKEFFLFNFLFL